MRDYRGLDSIQEVECSGGNVEAEVKLLSLKLFRVSDNMVLAHASLINNQCLTYGEFASCTIDTSDFRKSVLRVLVTDLEEGESRTYGCNAASLKGIDDMQKFSWTLSVTRRSESLAYFQALLECCASIIYIWSLSNVVKIVLHKEKDDKLDE